MAGLIISTEFESPGSGFADYLAYLDRESRKENSRLYSDDGYTPLGMKEHLAYTRTEGWDMPVRPARLPIGQQPCGYGRFLDYMDREKAKAAGERGQGENTIRTFSEKSDRLSYAEVREMKTRFAAAEEKGSLLWKSVMSFETEFLYELGIYDPDKKDVDDKALIEYSRAAIEALLKAEGFDTALFAGEIHKNKEHFHVHFAIVDEQPSWEAGKGRCHRHEKDGEFVHKIRNKKGFVVEEKVMPYKAGELWQRGKFKNSSHEKAKSVFVNSAMKNSDMAKKIGELMRTNMIGHLKLVSVCASGSELETALKDLMKVLPENVSLWKYGMNAMKPFREKIDHIASLYIDKHLKSEYAEFSALIKRQDDFYKSAYGKDRKGRSISDSKREDLYYRMGNTILKEAAKLELGARKAEKRMTVRAAGRRGKEAEYTPDALRALMVSLKRLLRKDIQSARNLAAYEQMQKEVEEER